MPGFGYIHRLKIKEQYPGVPTDLVEMLSHPIEGEVQDIDCMTEQEITKIEQKCMLWYQEDKLTLDQRRRQSYCALIQTLTQI